MEQRGLKQVALKIGLLFLRKMYFWWQLPLGDIFTCLPIAEQRGLKQVALKIGQALIYRVTF
jgi:hypothetical protein